MEDTYTVCGTLQVAGKSAGEILTQQELEDQRLTQENIASLVSSGVLELNEKPSKSTAKNKTGE